jgi:purine-cytosine permease-like protein
MIEHLCTLLQTSPLGLFVPVYAVVLLVHWFMNRREFKRCPEKGARYRALPFVYKLACWVIVMPMFAGILIDAAWFIPAVVAYLLVETACVRWYKKAGLLT